MFFLWNNTDYFFFCVCLCKSIYFLWPFHVFMCMSSICCSVCAGLLCGSFVILKIWHTFFIIIIIMMVFSFFLYSSYIFIFISFWLPVGWSVVWLMRSLVIVVNISLQKGCQGFGSFFFLVEAFTVFFFYIGLV